MPSPNSNGLQIDFFDADDSRTYFEYVLERLESALGPLEQTALCYLEVDSLELEGNRLAAWTEDVLEAFATRYAYDARPWLSLLFTPERACERGVGAGGVDEGAQPELFVVVPKGRRGYRRGGRRCVLPEGAAHEGQAGQILEEGSSADHGFFGQSRAAMQSISTSESPGTPP